MVSMVTMVMSSIVVTVVTVLMMAVVRVSAYVPNSRAMIFTMHLPNGSRSLPRESTIHLLCICL